MCRRFGAGTLGEIFADADARCRGGARLLPDAGARAPDRRTRQAVIFLQMRVRGAGDRACPTGRGFCGFGFDPGRAWRRPGRHGHRNAVGDGRGGGLPQRRRRDRRFRPRPQAARFHRLAAPRSAGPRRTGRRSCVMRYGTGREASAARFRFHVARGTERGGGFRCPRAGRAALPGHARKGRAAPAAGTGARGRTRSDGISGFWNGPKMGLLQTERSQAKWSPVRRFGNATIKENPASGTTPARAAKRRYLSLALPDWATDCLRRHDTKSCRI